MLLIGWLAAPVCAQNEGALQCHLQPYRAVLPSPGGSQVPVTFCAFLYPSHVESMARQFGILRRRKPAYGVVQIYCVRWVSYFNRSPAIRCRDYKAHGATWLIPKNIWNRFRKKHPISMLLTCDRWWRRIKRPWRQESVFHSFARIFFTLTLCDSAVTSETVSSLDLLVPSLIGAALVYNWLLDLIFDGDHLIFGLTWI